MNKVKVSLLTYLLLSAGLAQAQTLVGRPCLFNDYIPEWRCFPAILRDAQGRLTCGRNLLNLGGLTQATAATGPVCATRVGLPAEPPHPFHFAYRDPQGVIQDLCRTRHDEKDRWSSTALNGTGATQAPLAAGNPSGAMDQKVYHVVYRDGSGGIQDLAFDGDWQGELLNLDGRTGAPPAAGDPVQIAFHDQRHVLYRDADGILQDLWLDRGWHVRALNDGGLTQAPPAAGEASGLAHQGTLRLVYRDQDDQVEALTYDGVWHARRLTGDDRPGAPAATGDPVLVLMGGGRTPHVLYRDAEGGIRDLPLTGQEPPSQLNAGGATDAPAAGSDPVPMAPPSNWSYVAYVDRQGAGQLLTLDPQAGWQAAALDATTPPGGNRPMRK